MARFCGPFFCAALAVCAFLSGCGRDNAAARTIDPNAVAPAMDDAFKGAASEVKGAAGSVSAAIQANDDPRAFAELQQMSSRQDLTPEERRTVAAASAAMLTKLKASAAGGNKAAEDMVNAYRSSR